MVETVSIPNRPRIVTLFEGHIADPKKEKKEAFDVLLEIDGKIIQLRSLFNYLYGHFVSLDKNRRQPQVYGWNRMPALNKPAEDTTLSQISQVLGDEYGVMGRQFGKEIIDVLMSGNIDSCIGLNTEGGSLHVINLMTDLLLYASRQGGVIHTFAANQAASAGMSTFSIGSSRFALQQTDFMFHLSTLARGEINQALPPEVQAQELSFKKNCKRVEMDGVYAFFADNAKETYQSAIINRIQAAEADPLNTDNAVYFTGAEFRRYGVVNRAFSTVNELQEQFSLSSSPSLAKHPHVRRFFDVAKFINRHLAQLNISQRRNKRIGSLQRLGRKRFYANENS